MAPKKGQKMSLGAFLEDTTLGSWADEMDSLPTAPAFRTEEEKARGFDRGGRDYGTRTDRAMPPREELPLPTEPPYTAFVGNLPYDLTEDELAEFFAPAAIKTVKVIKDRDDRPKGFGYIEFAELDGLKEGLAKSGTPFQNRPIRVSVASPQQSKFAGEDDKFDQPWRRDGPLPPREGGFKSSRFDDGPTGNRFRDDKASSVSESTSDWRTGRPPAPPAGRFEDGPRPPRRSGLSTPTEPSAADTAESWAKGSKFTPSQDSGPPRGRFGGGPRSDRTDGPPRREPSGAAEGTGDWRSVMRHPRGEASDRSPSSSTPPTPQLGGRKKLELAPRSASGGNSAVESPLASPKMRSNPFGAARPVDVSARENEVAERLAKDRENIAKSVAEKTHMGRTPSKAGSERESVTILQPPSQKGSTPSSPVKSSASVSNVRPTLSFASAAGSNKKTDDGSAQPALPSATDVIEEEKVIADEPVDEVTAKVEDMTV